MFDIPGRAVTEHSTDDRRYTVWGRPQWPLHWRAVYGAVKRTPRTVTLTHRHTTLSSKQVQFMTPFVTRFRAALVLLPVAWPGDRAVLVQSMTVT